MRYVIIRRESVKHLWENANNAVYIDPEVAVNFVRRAWAENLLAAHYQYDIASEE